MQETSTLLILKCIQAKNINIHNCNPTKKNRINTKIEINKRLGMPFYIPLIALICSFLLMSRKDKKLYSLNKYIYSFIGVVTLVLGFAKLTFSRMDEYPAAIVPEVHP